MGPEPNDARTPGARASSAPARRRATAVLRGALGVGVVAWVSCASLDRTVVAPLDLPGATYVGNAVCADCHTHLTRVFAASPHGRYHGEGVGGTHTLAQAGVTGCESCHGPGSLHVKAGSGRSGPILNPGKDPTSCLACHLEVHAEFRLPHRHPVLEGPMNCVQCHDPHGPDLLKPAGGLAMARLNESCAACHREQTRPFVFEHEAMREGCATCHQVHGSVNAHLLVQRDVNLCLKCHAQIQPGAGATWIGKVDHRRFLQFGTCWSAGCHTAVHGSNVSPKMLY